MNLLVPETIEFFSCRICTWRGLSEALWTAHKISTGHVVFQTFQQRAVDFSPVAFCPRCRCFGGVRRQISSDSSFILVCNTCEYHGHPHNKDLMLSRPPYYDRFFSYAQVDEMTQPRG